MALYRHTLRGTLPGEAWSINAWSEGVGALGAAQTAWEAAVAALFDVNLLAIYSGDVSTTEASTASIDPVTNKQISRLSNAVIRVGTSVSDMLPHNLAVVVSLRTVNATRAGRGRFYMPPPAVNNSVNGRLASVAQTLFRDRAVAARGTLDLNGFAMVVRNPPPTPGTREVTRIEVDDVFDQQTRRRNKIVPVRIGTDV